MTSFADRLVIATLVRVAAGEFDLGAAAEAEAAEFLDRFRARALRREREQLALGQLPLRLEATAWAPYPDLRKRAPGDPLAIVAIEQRRGPRGRKLTFANVSGGRSDTSRRVGGRTR